MKRMILTATVALLSALTLWAQTEVTAPNLIPESAAAQNHHRNRQHNKQHSHHEHHHSSISGRR